MHLRTVVVGAALSAARTKGSYRKDSSFASRHDAAPCARRLAIAHKILIAAYNMLCGVGYRELGEAYLNQIDQTRTVVNLKRRPEVALNSLAVITQAYFLVRIPHRGSLSRKTRAAVPGSAKK